MSLLLASLLGFDFFLDLVGVLSDFFGRPRPRLAGVSSLCIGLVSCVVVPLVRERVTGGLDIFFAASLAGLADV